jgi:hypothetical protein
VCVCVCLCVCVCVCVFVCVKLNRIHKYMPYRELSVTTKCTTLQPRCCTNRGSYNRVIFSFCSLSMYLYLTENTLCCCRCCCCCCCSCTLDPDLFLGLRRVPHRQLKCEWCIQQFSHSVTSCVEISILRWKSEIFDDALKQRANLCSNSQASVRQKYNTLLILLAIYKLPRKLMSWAIHYKNEICLFGIF